MGLTANQNIEKKPEEKSEWTFRRLFPLGAISSLSKVFVNPFDVLLGYLVVVLGIAVLAGRHIEWMFWVLTILILFADLISRRTEVVPEVKPSKKTK